VTRPAIPDDLAAALRGVATASTVLVVTDFDGVLAPIVRFRDTAMALPENQAALRALTESPGVRVAIVSGRTLADLRRLAQAPPNAVLVGSHGHETGPAAAGLSVADQVLRADVLALLARVQERFPQTEVEVKELGAALHTRRADRAEALAATGYLLLATAELPGAHVSLGKEVVEVSVAGTTKGDAVTRLREQYHPHAVVVLGDDITDEAAFAVLDPADVSIKVGDGATVARFRVPDPKAVAVVFQTLLSARRITS
jgi:trehalose-phosphatase